MRSRIVIVMAQLVFVMARLVPVMALPRLDRAIVRATPRGTVLVQVARTSRAMTSNGMRHDDWTSRAAMKTSDVMTKANWAMTGAGTV